MMCTVVLAALIVGSMADEEPDSAHQPWLSDLLHLPPAGTFDTRPPTGDWTNQVWHSSQPLSSPEGDDDTYDSVDQHSAAPRFMSGNSRTGGIDDEALDVILSLAQQQQESPLMTKRQPPRQLGSVVDLYRSLTRGLSPFMPTSRNQVLSASPERRSGRRPAACRFGPFGFVCWNAASRGAVMRQRSSQ